MKRINSYTVTTLIVLFLSLTSFQGATEKVINYYGTAEIIRFNNADYKLSWSSHPNAVYYKHEYLPKGNTSEHFNDMLLLEFLQGDLSVKDAVQAQLNQITERKKTDAACKFNLVESPGGKEFTLDFTMSTSKNNKVNLVEWSAYHYKAYTDKAGHKGVILFGISHRAYDDKVNAFLSSLPAYRKARIKALTDFPIPKIQVK
jgi:hypothetical protein